MINKAKASLTLYLSWCLEGFILLVTVFVEILVINGEKERFEIASAVSLNSVLGEYSKELLERYDLLYIDSSYLDKAPAITNVEERIMYYMKENTEQVYAMRNSAWGNLEIEEAVITENENAASAEGRSFENQAVIYVKDSPHTISYVDEVTQVSLYKSDFAGAYGIDPMGEFRGYKAIVDGIPLPKKKDPKKGFVEVALSNPADWVYSLAESDYLYNCGDDNTIFKATNIDIGNLISNRGIANLGNIRNSYEENDIYFVSYLADHYGCEKNPIYERNMMCQLEYLINGNDSDKQNYEDAIALIFNMRFEDNLRIAFGDASLKAEALNVAALLEAAILNPAFIEPVANTIVASCAYLETISDMHSILNQGKVPIHKSSHSMSVMSVLSGIRYETTILEGFTYRQYLEGLILAMDKEKLRLRAMDVIEYEVRINTNNPRFCMDYCLEEIDTTIKGNGTGIKKYIINRKYGYF